jgi:arabinofuranosyltransferase
MMIFSLFDGMLVGCAVVLLAVFAWVWPLVRGNRWCAWGGLSTVVLFGLVHQLMYRTIAEDAFITFRYSLNLALGNGPVFNVGEQVEGYSNFLWMIILGGLHALSDLPIPITARVLGVLATLATIIVSYWLSLRINEGSRYSALLAALFLASSGSFVAHGPGGLETTFFTLLLMLTLLCAVRGWYLLAGLVAALATMTRPEGVLLVPLLALWVWLLQPGTLRQRVGHSVAMAGPFVFLIGPWTIWRVWYYGHLIPNAVAAKSGIPLSKQVTLGLNNAAEFLLANPFVLIVLILLVLRLFGRRHIQIRPVGWFLMSTFLLYLAIAIYVGGDWMPGWRYLAPTVPLACVLLLYLWHTNAGQVRVNLIPRTRPLLHVLVAAVMIGGSFLHPSLIPRVRLLTHQVEGLAEIGRWFHETLPPGTEIVVYANGALSYYAGVSLQMIDWVGLTDEHIAREGQSDPTKYPWNNSYDNEYLIKREPAIVSLSGRGFDEGPACNFSHAFGQAYDEVVFRFVESENPLGKHVNLLLQRSRKEEITRLLTSAPDVEREPCPE